jgi:hypothetical protein
MSSPPGNRTTTLLCNQFLSNNNTCFPWGLCRVLTSEDGAGFVSPLLFNLQDLRNRITAIVALVDRDMLTRVWDENDYRIDVCRITKNGHIEHL